MLFARKLMASRALLSPIPLPCQREAHFWYILPDEVQQPSLLNQYMDLLPPCERNSVSSIKEDKLRKGALLARVLVRSTLARYTNPPLDSRLLNFRKNDFGKPEVDWQHFGSWDLPSLHFNLSHTSSLVACGITMDMPIGIDVEEKQRKLRNNILLFARRYFSPREVDYLQAFSDTEIQRQEFIKLWTLKEAYVKAIGRGFSAAPFSSFTLRFRAGKGMKNPGETLSDTSQIILEASDDPQNLSTNWQFALFELASSHYASICVKREKNLAGNGGGLLMLYFSFYHRQCPNIHTFSLFSGNESSLLRLKVWKTLPFVEDTVVSGTDAVVSISGLL